MGSMGVFVQRFRFNDPVFAEIERIVKPQIVAGLALLVGLIDRSDSAKKARWILASSVRMADGRIALVCAGSVSLVPSLAASVRTVGLNCAAPHLDHQHHSRLSMYGICARLVASGQFLAGSCCWNTDPWQRPPLFSNFAGSSDQRVWSRERA